MLTRIKPAALSILLALLASGCAYAASDSVRSRLLLGEFTGDAGPMLRRELETRRPFLGSDKTAPRLSAGAFFQLSFTDDQESVAMEEKGREKTFWEEDKLTGEVYLVRADEPREVSSDYDFQRALGTLTVLWRLTDPENGGIASEGELVFRGERSCGSYLDQRGRPGKPFTAEAVSRDISAELVKQAAAGLIEMSGPLFTSGDLASAPDPLSQEARLLASRGDWEGASLLWEKLLTQNPSYVPALYNLGLFKEKTGELTAAWEYYRRAFLADQSPMYRAALTRVTSVLRHQNRLPRASGLSY